MWQIEFSDVAKTDLLGFDKQVRNRILKFLEERVAKHPAPRQIAEPLEGKFKGLHRFRVGDYRIVVHIRENQLTILVLFLDHRSAVYQRRSLPRNFEIEPGKGKIDAT